MRGWTRRQQILASVAGVGVALAGVVVGVALAVHVRYSCGGDVYALIQLYCTHRTHPYRTLGLIVAAGSVVVGIVSILVLARRSGADHRVMRRR